MKIAIAGASGFVGQYLLKEFPDSIIINRRNFINNDFASIKDVDIVINLVGAPVTKRWSKKYKEELMSSRIETTKKLVSAINDSNVKHFISTSATGIYNNYQKCDETCNELSNSFLGELSKSWEDEALKCNKDTTILRFGVILGKDGGALKKMLLPFKLGFGGKISDGKFMMSLISIKDLMKIYHFVIDNSITGIINAVSPNPISNYEFTKILGKVLKRPTIIPIPKFILKLLFSEGSSVLTDSQEIYPKFLLDKSFKFDYPKVEDMLDDILK
jgi:hypothetical protein